ncbi:MAG: hypothetical protein AB7K68_16965 [Bacteriovoracia bacterium]
MIIILLQIMVSVSAFSGRAENGGEPGPGSRPCNSAALSACLQNARAAEAICQGKTNEYKHQGAEAAKDLAARRQQNVTVSTALAGVEAQLASARAEMRFLDDLGQKKENSPELFVGSPSLENIFLLDQLSTEWDERYLVERRQKLKTQESALTISSQKFTLQQSEIESEISSLSRLNDFISGEINRSQNEVNTHAYMWRTGCREQVCSSN